MAISVPKAASKKTAAKQKNYAVLENLQAEVDDFLTKKSEFDRLEAELGVIKDEILKVAVPALGEALRDATAQDPGLKIPGNLGHALLVVKDDYRSGYDVDTVKGVIGTTLTKQLFRQRVSIAVKGDELAKKLDEEQISTLLEAVVKLFDKYDVAAAVVIKDEQIPKSSRELLETLTKNQLNALQETGFKVSSTLSAKPEAADFVLATPAD